MTDEKPVEKKPGTHSVSPRAKKSLGKKEHDEIDEAIANSKVEGEKNLKKKTLLKRGGIGLGVVLLGLLISMFFAPMKSTMAYGICKVFVEMRLQYPPTMKVNSVDTFSTSVRIWYTYTDSFGEYILEPIQCYYKPHETLPFALEKITIRRREIAQDTVEAFNKILPVIFANPPDLTIPKPPKPGLKNLKAK